MLWKVGNDSGLGIYLIFQTAYSRLGAVRDHDLIANKENKEMS